MNELTIIEPRPQPLTDKDYSKLEELVDDNFKFKTKFKRVWAKIDKHSGEYDYIEDGLDLVPTKDVPQQLIESLQRPFSNPSVGIHLTRLSVHKGFKGGDFGLQVIIEDAIKDLSGKSEWAFMKACSEIRKDSEEFFKYSTFVALVDKYHNSLFVDDDHIGGSDKKVEDEFVPDTAEQKLKVAELIKNSLNRIGIINYGNK